MIVDGYVDSGYVNSKRTFEVEIPDEDLEGLDESERNRVIDEYVLNEVWNHASWGWNERGK